MTDVPKTNDTKMTDVPTTTWTPTPGPIVTRSYTCGGTQNYCGHAGCPDMTKDYTTSSLQPVATCGGTLTYCGHPGCPDNTKPSPLPSLPPATLLRTITCGGCLTYCGCPDCPDLTIKFK